MEEPKDEWREDQDEFEDKNVIAALKDEFYAGTFDRDWMAFLDQNPQLRN